MNFLSFFSYCFDILGWQDVLEILFFSGITYGILRWLKRDERSNLLPLFYSYCGVIFFAQFLHLTTISSFICASTPIIAIIFILMHQDILQRNFITLRKKASAHHSAPEWPEILIRACLVGFQNNKELLCVIENTYELKTLVHTPFLLNTPLQGGIIELIIASTHFESNKILLLNAQGNLVAINSTWHFNIHESWQATEVKELPMWQQDGLIMTSKTDAIVFKTHASTRTFDVIIRGKLYDGITAATTLSLIKKYLHIPDIKQGEYQYDSHSQKESFKQHDT